MSGMDVTLEGPLTLDLSSVDKPPSEGWHTVEVEKASPGTTRAGDVKIFVVARDRCGAQCGHDEQTIIWNLMLEGAGLSFTKRCLGAMGYGVDSKMQFASVQALADSMLGRELQVQIKHNDKDSAFEYNVNAYRPVEAESQDIAW